LLNRKSKDNSSESLHFYASSLLFVYEGHSKHRPSANTKMIDFSHVFRVNSGKDDNYIHGLNYIYEKFCDIKSDLLMGQRK
jgi:hypothetical protein